MENPNIGKQKIKKIWDKNYSQFLPQFCSEDHTEFKNAIKAFLKQKIVGMNATELEKKATIELANELRKLWETDNGRKELLKLFAKHEGARARILTIYFWGTKTSYIMNNELLLPLLNIGFYF